MHDGAFSDPARERELFARRLFVGTLVTLLLTVVLSLRYFDLQISRHEDFATQSNNNRVLVRPLPPSRGLIYDRKGELIADNRPSYNLTIVPERSQNVEHLLSELGKLINISKRDIDRFNKNLRRRRPYEQTTLHVNLSESERAILAVNGHRLNGAETSARLIRHYPHKDLFAHAVGYVGRINERETQTIEAVKYSGTDSIGKIGLEKFYEAQLLGTVGSEQVETNARGRAMRILDQTPAVSGDNLTLYLDSDLQRVAFDAFQGERGALVAIEIETGGILAMVSTPSYDPNLFVTGISQNNYDGLLYSNDRPLFDRSIRGQYPPGSTIKPLFGLIALQHDIVTTEYKINDNGYFFFKGIERPWRDHNFARGGHGDGVDLSKAIIESCNIYFYGLGVKTGIDLLADYGSQFGLGAKTGIDMPSERPGIMPSRAWKKGAHGQSWFKGDTINTSIGQGFMLTTPLQLAVMSARIASRGDVRTPRLVKSINGVEQPAAEGGAKIDISPRHWDYMHKAMQDVVHSSRGTARSINKGLDYKIAGKTGTAQAISIDAEEKYDSSKLNKNQWDHALFVAFAPVENPKIAIGLIVENGEHGGSSAAPIARAVFDAYMESQEPTKLVTR
ncbi:penicillin-binding protein 2 [marine gamma proteobacterium HTCC2207]|uniref:Peptidoglycan D,D-transpeptidase MrdA n=1 Tax=gamma proteobacterium HTCC2207 TaxID=314287 RepID=Q1YSQ4_9GAMM|nr:penicillin-binding protein 2 [marine gamma proteobacterium HTCC2207] [gamma proteobacterium HTCC2207]